MGQKNTKLNKKLQTKSKKKCCLPNEKIHKFMIYVKWEQANCLNSEVKKKIKYSGPEGPPTESSKCGIIFGESQMK